LALSYLPDWFKTEEMKGVRNDSLFEILRRRKFALVSEYMAENYGSPDPSQTGDGGISIQGAQHRSIFFINLALWLAKPTGLTFEYIFDISESSTEKTIRASYTFIGFQSHYQFSKDRLAPEDLTNAKLMYDAILKLDKKSSIWISIRSIQNALREVDWAMRYLQFWIALESLFGPEDGREITFRLSERLALFLEPDREKAQQVFETVKKGYSWRSKIVHGMHLSKLTTEESGKLSLATEQIANQVIVKILNDSELIQKFSRGREKYLDGLIFS
jgi:hypothetical protein